MQAVKHNRWIVAMFVLTFCVFQNYFVIGRQDPRLMNPKRISDRSALTRQDSWIDVSVDLIVPRTAAGPTRVEHVSARSVVYAPTGTPQAAAKRATPLIVVADPRTGFTYVTRGNQTFYVSEESDIVACFMFANSINFGRSYIKVPSSPSGANAAIGRFVAEIPDERLLNEAWSDLRVVLQPAAPSDFFARGSQPVNATITAFDVVDEVLRLDMNSPGNRHTGSFWIDLRAIKLVRVVIDGEETFNAR